MKINRFRPRSKWLEVYWVSTQRWTVRVATEADGRIVEAAPLVRKFIGQPLSHLIDFARRTGGCGQVQVERLK